MAFLTACSNIETLVYCVSANICLSVLLTKVGVDCATSRDLLLHYVSSAASVDLCIGDGSSQYLHSSWLGLLAKVGHES